jgi:hypothetical protein
MDTRISGYDKHKPVTPDLIGDVHDRRGLDDLLKTHGLRESPEKVTPVTIWLGL